MSSLRQRLADESHVTAALKVHAPKPIALPEAVSAMGAAEGGSIAEEPIGILQQRVLEAVAAAQIAALRLRDFRRIPEGFFVPPKPLGRDRAAREAVLAEIARRRRRSIVYSLIVQYVERFDASDADFVAVARWLESAVKEWEWDWTERQREFAFFTVDEAPGAIARHALASENPREALEHAGLFDAGQTGSLGCAVFSAACGHVASLRGRQAIPLQERMMKWAVVEGDFRYPGQWPEFAEALLAPWGGVEKPSQPHQEAISNVLIGVAGDPRTTRRQTKWEAVRGRDPRIYEIFLAWLTRASILQFLDVVGQSALDEHWRYRRTFWESYLEAGHISKAWVAFGARAASAAQRVQSGANPSPDRPFGEIERGTGKGPDWSALILQIGDLTIADWSHSGKYNVWTRNADRKPEFFRQRYRADALDLAPIRDAHHGSENYYWQRKLADLILHHTGLRVDSSRWTPRRR